MLTCPTQEVVPKAQLPRFPRGICDILSSRLQSCLIAPEP
jgi:hypothetical protein